MRSKWPVPATVISVFLGCSLSHTRRLLKKLETSLQRVPSLKEVADFTYEYRRSVEERSVDRLLTRWRGPE